MMSMKYPAVGSTDAGLTSHTRMDPALKGGTIFVNLVSRTGRLKRSFLWASMMCISSAAWGQISLVHVTNCGPGAFPGTACTIPSTGTGNLLVVGWQIAGGGSTSTTISGMSDNAGNVYAEAGAARAIDTSADTVIDIWYAKNIAAGATSITINPSSTVSRAGVVIWEFSGADPTAPLDATAVLNSQAATSTPQGATVTTTAATDVIVSIAEVANSITGISSGNNFTNDSTLMSNGWAHLIASATGAFAPQWNQSSAGTYDSSTVAFKAASSGGSGNGGPCDLNQDGVVNSADVTLAVNMAIGTQTCTANLEGANTCTVITVQRVVNASQGQTCITYSTHAATLSWTASTSPNVSYYNVYRGTSTGGPYNKIGSTTPNSGTTTYKDASVQAGQTYYYVGTAVDTSGNESGYSNQAIATIPTP